MKKILMPLAVVALACASVISCKKDNAKSKTELLTKAGWKQTNGEIGASGVFTTDPDWSSAVACDKDDVTTFFVNKTYQATEGASKCNSSDPDLIDSGSWDFSADEKTLIVDGVSASIDKLDDNTMVLIYTESGISYRGTYSH